MRAVIVSSSLKTKKTRRGDRRERNVRNEKKIEILDRYDCSTTSEQINKQTNNQTKNTRKMVRNKENKIRIM